MLTIGIKTFCRPKTLEESLNILFNFNKTFYPIIIADDSNDKYKSENLEIIEKYKSKTSIEVIDLPFDSGLSKGRNEIVSKCKTKYIMILDDSRSFTSDLNVLNMIKFLEENNYQLFCGVINARGDGIDRRYCGLFDSIKITDGLINIVTKPVKKIESKLFNNIYETNIGVNVFIAKTECLKNVKWNDELKVGEHEMFFYKFYKFGYKCVISNDCNFEQSKYLTYPDNFNSYRKRDRSYRDNLIKIDFSQSGSSLPYFSSKKYNIVYYKELLSSKLLQ